MGYMGIIVEFTQSHIPSTSGGLYLFKDLGLRIPTRTNHILRMFDDAVTYNFFMGYA